MSPFDNFIDAVKSQDYETVQLGLRNENISVSAHDKNGKCALEYAIDADDLKMLEMMIESGRFDLEAYTCPDLENARNLVPIVYAASKGSVESVKLFLNVQKNIRPSGLYFAAALNGRLDTVKWLVNSALVDPHCRNDGGKNVLVAAAKHEKVFNYLVDEVKVDHKSIFPCTCHLGILAGMYGHVNIMKRYLEEGGDINQANEDGETSLNYAINFEHLELTKFLLENGATIDTIDNHGNSVIKRALEAKSEEFMKILDLENRISQVPESVLLDAAEVLLERKSYKAKSRFIKYVLHLMPDSYFTEGIFDFAMKCTIMIGRCKFIESMFKIFLTKPVNHLESIKGYILHAAKTESLAMFKEVVRVFDTFAEVEFSSKDQLELFVECFMENVSRFKIDFLDYLVSENLMPLQYLVLDDLVNDYFVEFLLSKNYDFPEKLLPQVEEIKKKLQSFQSEEAARPFDAAKIDNELANLEGDDFKRKLRFFLLDAIESQHYNAVKHILSKWKPSVVASDYLSYPVNVAAKVGHFGVFKALCEYGFSVNVFDADKTDAFVLAGRANHEMILSYIVNRGLLTTFGLKSLDDYPFPYVLFELRNEKLAIQMLRNSLMIPSDYFEYDNAHLLHLAALADMANLYDEIQNQDDNGRLNFSVNFNNSTPCHLAFAEGSIDVVLRNISFFKFLSVCMVNSDEMTPLDCALANRRYDFIKKLKSHWPEIVFFIEESESGKFKDLYKKYKPIFCVCGVAESDKWKSLNSGACESCHQKCDSETAVTIFPCRHLVHDSCLNQESPECPKCEIGLIISKTEDPNLKDQYSMLTGKLMEKFGINVSPC